MTDEIVVECPECNATESTKIVPTFRVAADLAIQVKEVRCSECGYEGEP